jgi:hypothetical protein
MGNAKQFPLYDIHQAAFLGLKGTPAILTEQTMGVF